MSFKIACPRYVNITDFFLSVFPKMLNYSFNSKSIYSSNVSTSFFFISVFFPIVSNLSIVVFKIYLYYIYSH